VREPLPGNLCRCTGYQKIADAVSRPHGGARSREVMAMDAPMRVVGKSLRA